jgi:hypothetical protein
MRILKLSYKNWPVKPRRQTATHYIDKAAMIGGLKATARRANIPSFLTERGCENLPA